MVSFLVLLLKLLNMSLEMYILGSGDVCIIESPTLWYMHNPDSESCNHVLEQVLAHTVPFHNSHEREHFIEDITRTFPTTLHLWTEFLSFHSEFLTVMFHMEFILYSFSYPLLGFVQHVYTESVFLCLRQKLFT